MPITCPADGLEMAVVVPFNWLALIAPEPSGASTPRVLIRTPFDVPTAVASKGNRAEPVAVLTQNRHPVPVLDAVSSNSNSRLFEPVVAPHVNVQVNAPIDHAVFAVGAVMLDSADVPLINSQPNVPTPF